jgi:2-succinyl-5-enolpyruvyl-6-hydroxy-3-cyclohexene-1-carboxylate synthase
MSERAKVVIIGGGIAGCSALYHLAKMGCTDVLLLERDELTSGSTWHAAGNVPTYSTSWSVMQVQKYSAALYRELAKDKDFPISYHVTGSVRLAHSEERMAEFRHVKSMARANNMEYDMLTPAELVDRYPLIKTHDLATSIQIKPLLNGGPVHLNVQFDEPLLSNVKDSWLSGIKVTPAEYKNNVTGKLEVTTGVLVIGHDRAGYEVSEVNEFASKLNWPVIAEDPISFPQAIAHTPLFLSDEKIREKLAPESIIVIGRTTLSRSTNNFIQLANKVIVIDPRISSIDDKRQADLLLTNLPSEVTSSSSDTKIWQKILELAVSQIKEIKWSEQLAAITICKLLPNDSALFVGSSRPVRDIEAFAAPRSGVDVFANRGLAGIDGNISTAFGIATKYKSSSAIMGDLTFLHDISALANKSKENLRIYVIDNNGGGIFSTLPQAEVENFDQLFGTPHNLDLTKVIAGFEVSVSKVSDLKQLQTAISKPIKGLDVVVVEVPSRESNAEGLKEITQRVSRAVRIGINLA